MTEFTAISSAMELCFQQESHLRRFASSPVETAANRATLLGLADEVKDTRLVLQQMRSVRTCHWTEDSDGQLHAHDQIWNPGDYVFCPTCGRQTSISKNHDL